MASTTAPAERNGRSNPSANGSPNRAEPLPLAPPRSVRSRVPQVLLAALLIVGGGLGGLLLFNNYDQRAPVVVVTAPVAHGTPLAREHLAVTEAALDADVATISSPSDVVGRFAAHDLQPGELLTEGDVATEDQLVAADESVVGLLLEPGGYPTRRLVAGDRVDVFAPGAAPTDAAEAAGGPLASDLVVFDVIESSSDGRTLLVSIVVTGPDEADRILDAAAGDGVRLSLRGRD